jgi:outer membrane lipoprotein-sorting protein
MLRAARLAVWAALAVFAASAANAQTADELIEKHLAAMGGRETLKKITSEVAFGTISVSVQGTDIGGPIEIYHKAPNKARTYFKLDLSAMGAGEMIVDQRCDGKTAVALNNMQGDREVTGSQLQNLLNQTFPTPLLDYKGAGAKVELAGKEKLNGRDVFVVVYTPKSGPASRQYFDAETFLLTRVVAKLDVPELGGETEQTVDASDYRVVDGMKVPFALHIQNPAQAIGISLNKVETNRAIDDAMFAKPAVK